MEIISHREFTEERALFRAADVSLKDCVIKTGESPFKHSRGVTLDGSTVASKYPLWYSENAVVRNSVLEPTARAGIWYSRGIRIENSKILSPKTFRRSEGIELENVVIPDAAETFWSCSNVKIRDLEAKGADYFFMNSTGIDIDGMTLDGR